MKKSSLSVISAVRNCQEETSAFLNSLEKFKPASFREMILVDDGSEEETKSFLKANPTNSLLRNEESKGFMFSNNFGVSQASGDWLLFLNNDLVLKRGWVGPFDDVVDGSKNSGNSVAWETCNWIRGPARSIMPGSPSRRESSSTFCKERRPSHPLIIRVLP